MRVGVRGQARPLPRPVWTVPAIVCGGRLLGLIVLAVSNLPRPLPGHRGGPRTGPRPPTAGSATRETRQAEPSNFPGKPPRPAYAAPGSLRPAPGSRPGEGDSPTPKPSRLFPRVSVMVKQSVHTGGCPTPSRREGRGRPRGAEPSRNRGVGRGDHPGRGRDNEHRSLEDGLGGTPEGRSGAPLGARRGRGARPLYLRLRLLGHFLARRRPGLN